MDDNRPELQPVSEVPPSERPAVTPIARTSLHDQLVARLRDLIIEGELAPGTRIPERSLCERFSVSRTPLREALKVLASDGLLELLPNRGAVVARITEADIEELFPVMGALEALAGEFACTRITEEELAEIRALHYQMVLHHRRRELPAYFRLNQAIHGKILEAARNPTLSRLYMSLAGRVRRARYLANMTPARWDRAVQEHEAILDALASRDSARLAGILKQHLAGKCATVIDALRHEAAGRSAVVDRVKGSVAQ